MVPILGPALGLPIGGDATGTLEWHWIIWIKESFNVVSFFLAFCFLRESLPWTILSLSQDKESQPIYGQRASAHDLGRSQ